MAMSNNGNGEVAQEGDYEDVGYGDNPLDDRTNKDDEGNVKALIWHREQLR
jgi:hypothetical protein